MRADKNGNTETKYFLQPKILPRMFGCQNVTLLGKRNMCVDLGDVDGTMTKHFLNVADVYIRFQQTGCESVAEHVRGDVLVDCGA